MADERRLNDLNGKTVQSFEFFLRSWKWLAAGVITYGIVFGTWVVNRDMAHREFQAATTASRFTQADARKMEHAFDDAMALLANEQKDHQGVSGHPEITQRVKSVEDTIVRLESNQQRILSVQQSTREAVATMGAKIDRLLASKTP